MLQFAKMPAKTYFSYPWKHQTNKTFPGKKEQIKTVIRIFSSATAASVDNLQNP